MLFPKRRCRDAVAWFLTFSLLTIFQSKVEARVSSPVTSVLVQWDANPEPDIVAYKLYRGTESGVYSQVDFIDEAVPYPSHLVTDLTLGQPYYCVITAVNGDGFESGFSDEFVINEPQGRFLGTVEAEDGVITEPFVEGTDGTHTWLESPTVAGGSARVPVNIHAAGSYTIWCRVLAPSTSEDSYFVSVDDGAPVTFHVYGTPTPDPAEISSDWIWRPVQTSPGNPLTFDLSPGEHFIEFELREAGGKLDRVLVTNNADFVPSGNLVAGGSYLEILDSSGGGTVSAGSPLRLEVDAMGSGPILIQWYRNGIALPGQTSANLRIPGATPADAGSYVAVLTSGTAIKAAGPFVVEIIDGEPLRVDAFTRLSDTRVEFRTSGQLGSNVTIEASPDLEAWGEIDTQFNFNGVIVVDDPEAAGKLQRYYRLEGLPAGE